MEVDKMINKLEKVLTPKRFAHSLNVMKMSVDLAKKYCEDVKKAEIAGLLHDCARDIRGGSVFRLCEKYNISTDEITCAQPELLHGPIGSFVAKEEYGIHDKMIESAIYCHTTGRASMGMLDKIVFIADYIEPDRSFPGVEEVRELVYRDMDKAMIAALNMTIIYVVSKGALIHPDTINARNSILLSVKKQI